MKIMDNKIKQKLQKEIQDVVKLYTSRNYFEAEVQAQKLIKVNPNVVFLHNLIGLILYEQGKLDEAVASYNVGLNISPKNDIIYNNLGTVYKAKNNFLKAEDYYKKAIQLNKQFYEAHNNLGNLYIEINNHNDAINSFKNSIKIKPNFHIAYYNLAVLYKSIGRFKEAIEAINKVIEIFPKFYEAYRILSQIVKYKTQDDSINNMINLYDQIDTTTLGKISLGFAIGKAFDDLKKYKEAFFYYEKSNILRRNNIKFNFKKEENEFKKIKSYFNVIKKDNLKLIKSESPLPIFIVGMPRSGTTLVEQIISSHPDVYGGGELDAFNKLIKKYFYKNNIFTESRSSNEFNKILKKIRTEYIYEVKETSGSYRFITDKLPINFKWVGFIKLIFPESKIIHCTRDPRDTCLSIFKNYFTSTELNYAYNLDEMIKFYNIYNNLMDFWKSKSTKNYSEVHYEELVRNTKSQIKKIIENCDLDWNNSCLKFYNNDRPVKTASDTQVRNKIYSNSLNSWKNYEKYVSKDFTKLIIN